MIVPLFERILWMCKRERVCVFKRSTTVGKGRQRGQRMLCYAICTCFALCVPEDVLRGENQNKCYDGDRATLAPNTRVGFLIEKRCVVRIVALPELSQQKLDVLVSRKG